MPECNHLDHTSAVIDNDLRCAVCGYNLHGLRYEGACPECGGQIENVIVPSDLRFTSFRSIKRTRLGVALWAVSLGLPPLGMIAFSMATFISPAYWSELHDRQSAFHRIHQATVYAWAHAPSVAAVVLSLSIIVITFPPRHRFERFKPRLGLVVAALAIINGAYTGLSLYWRFSGLGAAGASTWHLVLWWIAMGAYGLALCLGWIYLTTRLHREYRRRLRTVMWTALAAVVLISLGIALQGFIAMTSPWARATTGVIFSFPEQPSWWTRLSDIGRLWSKYGDRSCRIIMLAVLWAYLRRLTTGLPQLRMTQSRKLRPTP